MIWRTQTPSHNARRIYGRAGKAAGPEVGTEGSNRRRYERHLYEREGMLTELSPTGQPAGTWPVRLQNLSRCGMGLCSKRMVHVARHVLLELPGFQGGPARLHFGVVRQTRYAEGEGYIVGVEFQPRPKTQAIQQWLRKRGW